LTDTPTRVPLSEPSVGQREAAYLLQCIDENWVASKGRFVTEFERLFASIHSHADAVSTTSGTAALHLACLELGLGSGDEVLVPAMTFAASANAVLYAGATPVFVDIDPHTFTIDPSDAAARISPRTRAIMIVHLYGHPVDMDAIDALASEHGLAVIEDATEALGSRYGDRLCGTLSAFGCFSFNGNKVITAGGGGMILARDPDQLAHVRHLTLQSRVPGTSEYLHDEVGFNYTLSNLQAAVGLAQLERLDEFVGRRREIARRYARDLGNTAGLAFSVEAEWAQSNYWLMSVLVDESAGAGGREAVMSALARAHIDARPFFTPLPLLAPYADVGADPSDFPVARAVHARGISIPSSASLDPEQQDRVIEVLTGAA
jgi:perosamine synthetase